MTGRGSIRHNNRSFSAANVDRSRSGQNVTFCNEDLKKVYHELFDEALAAYNAKKKKTRDKIPDYYEHIRQSKQEKLFHEAIFQIGNLTDCGCGSPGGERAAAALKEFAESFQERNPHLRVFNMVLHMDEATPHLHVDFVPVATEQSRGLSTRVSMKQALKQQGFEGLGRKQTEWKAWMEREKEALTEIAQAHEFDIDGTVALGDVLLPGAAEFFQEIKERGGQFVFITNNSTKSIADYIKKFRQMGVSTDPQNFVTASTASASWLRQHAAGKTIYTLGTRSLIRELEGHGIRVTTDPDTQDISFVLVAYDSELTYKKLTDTCRILQTRPVTFLATNPDLVCPVPFGYVPDCGSICQMITNATGQVPHYIGKPSIDMVDIALRENPFSKEETVIVGDRFYTDIACGNASGVETVLVLTGEAKKTDTMIHTYSPTYIFDSIKEVKKAWKN